ncbi:hypothetical protein [Knoellia koreensis]|uniref:Transcriptional regulator, AbiEi antitoxin, Type IV TA system n=1 Tax=Knoellia koreensis TaxID=2730921 RepID=A0A849HU19_9MICO|nr:hypothetical protein [Knoellia sp. DB2414S]NNM48087.1 hypothetical protein [Knoellia sp. DB2414S]
MPFDPSLLRCTGDLRRVGVVPPARDADGSPRWVRVRRGAWYPAAGWTGLDAAGRYAALVHATALVGLGEGQLCFSHESAAVLLGLPRIGAWPDVVHVLADGRAGWSGIVRRHTFEGVEPIGHAGLRVTSPARTVVDLARCTGFTSALAAADHALREELCTPEDLVAALDALPRRASGLRVSETVVRLADPRSMSVGESLSRAQMFLHNLPRPELQVAWEHEEGLIGYTDFGWDEVVGEFDGKVKYGAELSAGDPAGVVWREKLREDRLRARGARVARWVWREAVHPEGMVARLAAQGIRPQRRNTWFDAGEAEAG